MGGRIKHGTAETEGMDVPEFVKCEIVVVRSANLRFLPNKTPANEANIGIAIRKCGVGSRSEPRLSGTGPKSSHISLMRITQRENAISVLLSFLGRRCLCLVFRDIADVDQEIE